MLNFGISNYGVGQYLLTWEQYASRYSPDYVAIFVAGFHMKRTIDRYEYGAFTATAREQLWIRPTFRFEDGLLVRESARDFDKFVKAQEDLIKSEFAGRRIRKKPMQLLTLRYARPIGDDFGNLVQRFYRPSTQIAEAPQVDPDVDSELLVVNLEIIKELGRQVHGLGSKLVVVDASRYFGDSERVSTALNELSATHGFGYIPIYSELVKANLDGVSTRWAHDGHFNDAGNMILAASLYDYILATLHASTSQ